MAQRADLCCENAAIVVVVDASAALNLKDSILGGKGGNATQRARSPIGLGGGSAARIRAMHTLHPKLKALSPHL